LIFFFVGHRAPLSLQPADPPRRGGREIQIFLPIEGRKITIEPEFLTVLIGWRKKIYPRPTVLNSKAEFGCVIPERGPSMELIISSDYMDEAGDRMGGVRPPNC